MEISALTIYLIMQVDTLIKLFSIAGGILLIASIIIAFAIAVETEDFNAARRVKPFIIAGAIAVVLAAIIPSTKTMIAMTVIPPIVKNEDVRELPSELMHYVRLQLKELTKELKDNDRPASDSNRGHTRNESLGEYH